MLDATVLLTVAVSAFGAIVSALLAVIVWIGMRVMGDVERLAEKVGTHGEMIAALVARTGGT
jgi:hypothetical protein